MLVSSSQFVVECFRRQRNIRNILWMVGSNVVAISREYSGHTHTTSNTVGSGTWQGYQITVALSGTKYDKTTLCLLIVIHLIRENLCNFHLIFFPQASAFTDDFETLHLSQTKMSKSTLILLKMFQSKLGQRNINTKCTWAWHPFLTFQTHLHQIQHQIQKDQSIQHSLLKTHPLHLATLGQQI